MNKRKLDDTKSYGSQLKKESFQWAKPLIKLLKQDKEAKYWQVEAHFPVSSMNSNIYTRDELLNALHSLPGKHVDLNHNLEWKINGAEIVAANFEGEATECILRVLNSAVDAKQRNVNATIESGEIDHVSIEADAPESYPTDEGTQVKGLSYTGLALLDQDSLPGIPLTRLMPLESLRESIFAEVENQTLKEDKKTLTEDKQPEQATEKSPEKLEKEAGALKELADTKQELVDANKRETEKDDIIREKDQKILKLTEENTRLKREKASEAAHITMVFEGIQQKKDERIDALEKANTELEEKVTKLTAKNAGLNEQNNSYLKQLKDESEKRAQADQRAINEMKETTKVKEENADLAQENADLTRKRSEDTQKIADLSKKLYAAEKELSSTKESLGDVSRKYRKIRRVVIKT